MRIGILGGGISGLSAAWLLEDAHDVTLLERGEQLGGHALTINVSNQGRRVPIDLGFQYFSANMYPAFSCLLQLLGVTPLASPQSLTLEHRSSGRALVLPPRWRSVGFLQALGPRTLSALLSLRKTVVAGMRLEEQGDWSTSVEEFLKRNQSPGGFGTNVLLPLLAALGGTSLQHTRECSARALMKYLVFHQPKNPITPFPVLEVPEGSRTYVERLRRALRRADVRVGAGARRLQRNDDRYVVTDDRGMDYEFDQIVFATPAYEALRLVQGLAGSEHLQKSLERFQHLATVIAAHADPSTMPAARSRWSTSNAIFDGRSCPLTTWSGHRAGVDVFKSWITHSAGEPRDAYGVYRFKHVFYTPDYFRAQAALGQHHGEGGLWFAGSYTQDIDSHESGLRSAMEVCRRLNPSSHLMKKLYGAGTCHVIR